MWHEEPPLAAARPLGSAAARGYEPYQHDPLRPCGGADVWHEELPPAAPRPLGPAAARSLEPCHNDPPLPLGGAVAWYEEPPPAAPSPPGPTAARSYKQGGAAPRREGGTNEAWSADFDPLTGETPWGPAPDWAPTSPAPRPSAPEAATPAETAAETLLAAMRDELEGQSTGVLSTLRHTEREGLVEDVETRFTRRLRDKAERWREIGASPTIMKWIVGGYDLELVDKRGGGEIKIEALPPHVRCDPTSNGQGAETTYKEETAALLGAKLLSGCAEMCTSKPTLTLRVDVVPKKNGKLRVVCDGRPLNEWVKKRGRKVRLETLSRMRGIFTRGHYLWTIDISSAFNHVEIREQDRNLLGFKFKAESMKSAIARARAKGVEPYIEDGYVYMRDVAMPFGGCFAPAVFTRLMRVVSREIKRRWPSISHLCYVDDFVFCGTRAEAEGIAEEIVELLESLGLKVSDKSELTPSLSVRALGFDINTETMTFGIPSEKRTEVLDQIAGVSRRAAARGTFGVKEIASLTGRIVSMRIAIGPNAQLFTRALVGGISDAVGEAFKVLRNSRGEAAWLDEIAKCWKRGTMTLNAEQRRELKFWSATLREKWTAPIESPGQITASSIGARISGGQASLVFGKAGTDIPDGFDGTIEVDAGGDAWGAELRLTGDVERDRAAVERFIQSEIADSSTLRETKALNRSIKSWAPRVAGRRLLVRTDNLGLARIWRKGSKVWAISRELQELATTLTEFKIDMDLIWVPREWNTRADFLSKVEGSSGGETSLSASTFATLDDAVLRLTGHRHSVDAFAARGHVQRDIEGSELRFFSRWHCRGSSGTNFFRQDLREEGPLFVFPPTGRGGGMKHIFEKLRTEGAVATVVGPDPLRPNGERNEHAYLGAPLAREFMNGRGEGVLERSVLNAGSAQRADGRPVVPLVAVVVDFRP